MIDPLSVSESVKCVCECVIIKCDYMRCLMVFIYTVLTSDMFVSPKPVSEYFSNFYAFVRFSLLHNAAVPAFMGRWGIPRNRPIL